MRISVCKCLKQERELLSHCSQLKWITKPLQGIQNGHALQKPLPSSSSLKVGPKILYHFISSPC